MVTLLAVCRAIIPTATQQYSGPTGSSAAAAQGIKCTTRYMMSKMHRDWNARHIYLVFFCSRHYATLAKHAFVGDSRTDWRTFVACAALVHWQRRSCTIPTDREAYYCDIVIVYPFNSNSPYLLCFLHSLIWEHRNPQNGYRSIAGLRHLKDSTRGETLYQRPHRSR